MYRDFTRWLFDGSSTSPIPNQEELLKYNSPINHQYVLQCFLPHPKLTQYLNKYFNNFSLYQLSKKEFFIFIKKLVIELNLNKSHFNYKTKRENENNDLFKKLKNKLPELKNYDISLLAEIINNLEDNVKESYYSSLGLTIPKKRKLSGKRKKEKIQKISLDDYISKYYNVI